MAWATCGICNYQVICSLKKEHFYLGGPGKTCDYGETRLKRRADKSHRKYLLLTERLAV